MNNTKKTTENKPKTLEVKKLTARPLKVKTTIKAGLAGP